MFGSKLGVRLQNAFHLRKEIMSPIILEGRKIGGTLRGPLRTWKLASCAPVQGTAAWEPVDR